MKAALLRVMAIDDSSLETEAYILSGFIGNRQPMII